jgi:hypothetical protein
MPYPIHRYATNQSGPPFTTLNDREVNTSATSLRLLGRFTPGYGEALNENLLWLLENFAGTSAPTNGISGQLWFNSASNTLQYRDVSGVWREAARRVAQPAPPNDGPPVGQIWVNTSTNSLSFLDTLGGWRQVSRHITASSAPADAPNGQVYLDTTSNTLNYRDRDGAWQEVVRQGGAFVARYADVAERYEASEPMEPGDVVEIGGDKEVQLTRTDASREVFGVVSTNPALRLNSGAGTDATHPFIALTGRIPCKVTGPVRKGQRLVSSEIPGVARGANETTGEPIYAIFGRSLVTDQADGVRLVEIVLGSR